MEAAGQAAPGLVVTLEVVLERLRAKFDPAIDARLLNLYQLGSRVYGTANEQSDWDFMAIVTHTVFLPDDGEHYLWECYDDGEINVALYDAHYFGLMVREHRMEAIECVCLPRQYVWLEKKQFVLELDLDVLRPMVSWITRLRMSMAQKRMTLEPYKAKKCIFHAIRYIVFALQVVEHGKVVDYSAANHYLKEIMDHPSSEWEGLKAAFQKPVFFKLRGEFFNKARYHELYSRMDVEAEVHAHLFNPRDKAAFLASDIDKLNHLATTGSTAPDGEEESSADPSGLLETVRFLREQGVQQLRQRYHLRVLPHSQHANIIHLAPTIASPRNSALVRECGKGLIVDARDNWTVLCRSFPTFFTDGQAECEQAVDDMDWGTAKIYERIDGNVAHLYWNKYQDTWNVASQWEPDAIANMCYLEVSERKPFQELFWDVWRSSGYALPTETHRCFTFVMATNRQRYVTSYPEDKLFLVSVTDLRTMREEDFVATAESLGWTLPKRRDDLGSWAEAKKLAIDINPLLCSGFVAVDAGFRRVGVKSPQFVAMACTLTFSNNGFGPINLNADALDEEGMLELIRNGAAELLLHHFPRWRPLHDRLVGPFDALCTEIDEAYRNVSTQLAAAAGSGDDHSGDARRRHFAQLAGRYPFKPALFALDKGVVLTARECMHTTRNKALLKYVTTRLLGAAAQ